MRPRGLDATDDTAVRRCSMANAVVSAVPYALGMQVATAAVATATHYFDFGGNPTMVGRQLLLDEIRSQRWCGGRPRSGLAPGAGGRPCRRAFDALGDGPIDEVRALTSAPSPRIAQRVRSGTSWPSTPPGLINEYAEPCEVLVDGKYATVEPLLETEVVEWAHWGPLEAFTTAGGSSSLPRRWEGRVENLDYKTLRFRDTVIFDAAQSACSTSDATRFGYRSPHGAAGGTATPPAIGSSRSRVGAGVGKGGCATG